MKKRNLVISITAVILAFGGLAGVGLTRKHDNSEDQRICLRGGYCLLAIVIPSSYDALPKGFQQKLQTKYFVEDVIDRYSFTNGENGQVEATISGKRYEAEIVIFQLIQSQVETDGFDYGPMVADFELARPQQLDQFGTACDLSKAGRIFGFNNRDLRECVRSAYLLQSVPEFNDRTQKLFNNVTVKYENGTTGPLSLKRDGLTDADRKMVLREVAKIDAKARSLGGFR